MFTNGKFARAAFATVLISVMITATGCGRTSYDYDPNPPEPEPVVNYEPSDAEIDEAMRESEERFSEWVGWSCSYDATMNDDWHDDVVCRRGSEVDRPYLREWDDFVTYDELMASAAEHEDALNAGQ